MLAFSGQRKGSCFSSVGSQLFPRRDTAGKSSLKGAFWDAGLCPSMQIPDGSSGADARDIWSRIGVKCNPEILCYNALITHVANQGHPVSSALWLPRREDIATYTTSAIGSTRPYSHTFGQSESTGTQLTSNASFSYDRNQAMAPLEGSLNNTQLYSTKANDGKDNLAANSAPTISLPTNYEPERPPRDFHLALAPFLNEGYDAWEVPIYVDPKVWASMSAPNKPNTCGSCIPKAGSVVGAVFKVAQSASGTNRLRILVLGRTPEAKLSQKDCEIEWNASRLRGFLMLCQWITAEDQDLMMFARKFRTERMKECAEADKVRAGKMYLALLPVRVSKPTQYNTEWTEVQPRKTRGSKQEQVSSSTQTLFGESGNAQAYDGVNDCRQQRQLTFHKAKTFGRSQWK
ncbi:hypothetical protein BKA67DRAFT_551834 [Truncatella angustata]|uniref:Uncharacterized protein n=1 Tax=Truncatella angustata TaxID=152316 RepID=A0A9P8UQT1_9PEZI|nr:uncharacterized protein BKA67DRAFT_551834 [Truncatella angustata]KAH6656407.1 hypothetical protein BKA67DRAFT_551834 [Truncatella angustata]